MTKFYWLNSIVFILSVTSCNKKLPQNSTFFQKFIINNVSNQEDKIDSMLTNLDLNNPNHRLTTVYYNLQHGINNDTIISKITKGNNKYDDLALALIYEKEMLYNETFDLISPLFKSIKSPNSAYEYIVYITYLNLSSSQFNNNKYVIGVINNLENNTTEREELLDQYFYLKLLNIKSYALRNRDKIRHAMVTSRYALEYINLNNLSQKMPVLTGDTYRTTGLLGQQMLLKNYSYFYIKGIEYLSKANYAEAKIQHIKINLSYKYADNGDIDRAISILDSIINNGIKDQFIGYYVHMNLGYIHLNNNHNLAQNSFHKALTFCPTANQCTNNQRTVFNMLSELHLKNNQIDSAEYYLDLALSKDNCIDDTNSILSYYKLQKTKGDILYGKCNSYDNLEYCIQAYNAYQEQDKISTQTFSADDQIHFSDYISLNTNTRLEIIKDLIKYGEKDKYIIEAAKVMEQSKARILKTQLQDASNNLNAKNIEELLSINQEIDALLKSCDNFKKIENNKPNVFKNLYILYKKKSKILNFNDKVNTLKLSFDLENSAKRVQVKLKEKNAQIFEYHVNELGNWLLYHSPDTSILIEIKYDSLRSDAHKILKDISKQSNDDSLRNLLNKMYENLISPVLDSNYKNIIIIPSQTLNSLPFEAFLTKKSSAWSDNNYLVNKYNIQYTFSLNRYLHRKEAVIPLDKITLFSYTNKTTQKAKGVLKYPELRVGYDEVIGISNIFPKISSIFSGSDFTKRKIFNHLDNSILHISSHAFSNINNRLDNKIILRDNRGNSNELYGFELKNKRSKAFHIVLSACETGFGEINNGAGTFSLSNILLGIGAKSILKTMWQVSEVKSKELMLTYYQNIKYNSLSVSLTKSKNEFLKKNKETKYIHPFYWSGFLLEGNGDIQFNETVH